MNPNHHNYPPNPLSTPRPKHQRAAYLLLYRDPTIKMMAEEIAWSPHPVSSFQNRDGTPTTAFAAIAYDQYKRRSPNPELTHPDGPAEVILQLVREWSGI